jgi:predicted DNA binding protein/GAF domain-containing protein
MVSDPKKDEDTMRLVELLEESSDWKEYTRVFDNLCVWNEKLLDTETKSDLFQEMVDIVLEDLQFSTVVIYWFDEQAAKLHPKATPIEAAASVSPGEHPVWEAFKRDTATVSGGAMTNGKIDETGEKQYIVPFGEGGVLLTGGTGGPAEDERAIEILQMLCNIAESTLEEIQYRQQLRERDQELAQRSRTLERIDGIMQTWRAVSQTAISADTRDELEREVCNRVVENDVIEFVWIGGVDRSEEKISPHAWAGAERGYLEQAPIDLDADGELTARTARTNEVTVVDNVASGPKSENWRFGALERGFKSAMAVPLSNNGILHGVLTAYGDRQNAFEGAAQLAGEIGNFVGHAITAIQSQNGLVAHTSTELEIKITAPACFFVRFVRETKTNVSFEAMSPTESGSVLVFVKAEDPERLIEHAESAVAVRSVRLLEGDTGEGTIEGQFDDSFIGLFLSNHGITLESAYATPEETRITVSIPPTMDPRQALEIINSEYPNSKLLAKRDCPHRARESVESRIDPFDRLTERQREVVQRAYREGYFETPKEATSESLAESLDISTSAFHNHLRAAEAELFAWLFDSGAE